MGWLPFSPDMHPAAFIAMWVAVQPSVNGLDLKCGLFMKLKNKAAIRVCVCVCAPGSPRPARGWSAAAGIPQAQTVLGCVVMSSGC